MCCDEFSVLRDGEGNRTIDIGRSHVYSESEMDRRADYMTKSVRQTNVESAVEDIDTSKSRLLMSRM